MQEDKDLSEFIKLSKETDVKRQNYENFIETIKNLDPLDKAHRWLEYIANNIEDYSNLEALIYLKSRGFDCSNIIQEIIDWWKRDSIEYRDSYRFWSGSLETESFLDVSMLKVKEMLEIGGFDDWFIDLEKEFCDINFDINPDGSYTLFEICRSDYCINNMNVTLKSLLNKIIGFRVDKVPWIFDNSHLCKKLINIAFISHLVFSYHRIMSNNQNNNLIDEACEILLKLQNAEGCWSTWENDNYQSIYTTAVAIHALCLYKPKGWKHSVLKARDWIINAQNQNGFWCEASWPMSIHLSVLVMDAIELASESSNVTFYVPLIPNNLNKKNVEELLCIIRDNCENSIIELKASFEYNCKTKQSDEDLKKAILKTITAFLNTKGGILLIGIQDDLQVCGISKDLTLTNENSLDKYQLKIRDYLKSKIFPTYILKNIDIKSESYFDKTICRIEVKKSNEPVYVIVNQKDYEFNIRLNNQNQTLNLPNINSYIREHWEI